MDKYFAASNSARGFCSYYDDCFSVANKLYIIKGGPGTGKSGFMHRVALCAEAKGHYVEYFYCSSDPDSLDGIIIYKGSRRLALLDGTSPHVYDMTYPGIRDNIINLGDAWDEDILDKSKDEILTLCKKKSDAYSRAYDVLGSCGNLYAVIDSYIGNFLKKDKMAFASQRLVEKYSSAGNKNIGIRLIDSVSMKGRVRFDTFEKGAKSRVVIGDTYGAGHKMLYYIKGELDRRGCDYYISFDPVIPQKINAIFERRGRVAYVLSDPRVAISENESVNYVNIKRFIGVSAKEVKNDLKYAFSLYRSSLELALRHLDSAREYHFALEEIYKSAMDFIIVNEKIAAFCAKVL